MAELVEYGLVVLVSSLVMAFSVVGYGSFASSVSAATQQADYSSYVANAFAAIQQGSSTVTLTLENTTLSCSHGTLLFASPAVSTEDVLPIGCHFEFQDLSGSHRLFFSSSGGTLNLRVD